MVAPKNISRNAKEKTDPKSKSPSPEPFHEPDGMTTIDLNKSDDYSKESELETSELKKRAQIKYVAQLLFALGSIFVIVLLIMMMTFLNKEYHLFTVIPLQINQSYTPGNNQYPTSTEDLVNLTEILNREKFRKHLKSGKYIEQFPLEMDLCKIFKSTEFCCDIFKYSNLHELSEHCTVNDMLKYLIAQEIDSIENRQIYEHSSRRDWSSPRNDHLDYEISKEPNNMAKIKNLRNKRQFNYDPLYEPQFNSYNHQDSVNKELHQQQNIDPYNDFNQYQPPEPQPSNQYQPPNQYHLPDQFHPPNQYRLPDQYEPIQHYQSPKQLQPHEQYQPHDQYQPLEQYRPPNLYHLPEKFHRSNNKYDYLQAPHISEEKKIKPANNAKNVQHNAVVPQIINQKYQFPENIISDIESFNRDLIFQNLKNEDEQRLFVPEAIEQFESFGMGQKLEINKNTQFSQPQNKGEKYNMDSVSTNPISDVSIQIDTHNVADSSPKLQSVLLPLTDHVRENILHHVTVAPKSEYDYKSFDFQPANHFDENHQESYDFEEADLDNSGRLNKDEVRPNVEYRLKVYANEKLHRDSNQERGEEGGHFRQKHPHEDFKFEKNSDKMNTYIKHGRTSNLPVDIKERISPEIASNLLGSSLNIQENKTGSQIKIPLNTFVLNNERGRHLEIADVPNFNQNVLNISKEYSQTTKNMLESTILPVIEESTHDVKKEWYDTTTKYLEGTENRVDNPPMPILKGYIDQQGYKTKNTKNNSENSSTDEKISQNYFVRSNTAQDAFRVKQKQDSFTASEDIQSNQQTFINPCFNPYMSPYMPFMPTPLPPVKVGSIQEPGYLKVVSVSQPQVQNQPMYVLNPSMLYGIPPTSQSHSTGLIQSPFLPQGYLSQISQSPYGGNSPVQVTSPGGQYYMCNPIPTPTNNIAGLAGVEVRRDASNLQSLMEEMEVFGINNKSREAATLICPFGEQPCLDNIKCIKNHHVCDSEVHCDDSSDEIGCNCKDRVGRLRLCDGYCDCPTCDDEQGCFGCETDEYSCDDWSRFRRSTCIPISQRCDGVKQCEITGKDEMDCSILVDHIGNFPLNKVSNSVGFLHRNYKGKWYPTCFGTELWAAEVCLVEAGPSAIIPKAHMTLTRDPYNGLFINILPNNEVSLVNSCVQDRAAFVECPPIYCGLRFLINNPYRTHEVDTSIEDMLNDLERAYKLREGGMARSNIDSGINIKSREEAKEHATQAFNKTNVDNHNRNLPEDDIVDPNKQHRKTRNTEQHDRLQKAIESLERTFRRREISEDDNKSDVLQQSRVVGGKPSQPAAWPWLISIYKNGIFHCGGVLINELWIITASHCVDRYWLYYYEIQAGALRRFSYSPMDQRRWATVIVPHEFYSKSNLRNDIALMKMSAPLRYNKYVRPICLPSEATAGQDFLKGPRPGTICTTVGWGATVEHGADPDHMREVEVPILQHCKHKEDSDIEEICAGLTDGGKDACQGDSGGPLMCRNPNNPNQWYLAGIVSHGEGCARPNEPGVYTKVSRYMGWIAENTREGKFTVTSPLHKCPGFVCKGTKRCVPKKRRCDRIIDCLLGDDEINCEDHFRQLFKHSRKSVMPSNSNSQPTYGIKNGDFIQNLQTFEDLVGSTLNETSTNGKEKQLHIISTKNETDEKSAQTDNNEILDKESQEKKFQQVYFRCQIMLQVISANKRCDKIMDCEDGTDEFNCTCADYIKNVDPNAICDGVSDCPDLSDEFDCITCNKTQYPCRLAQKCIDLPKRCDGTADCPQNEDEMNCASLTNGRSLTLDRDNRPMFKSRGIVTVNYNSQWKPLCLNTSSSSLNDAPSIATVICNVLGFDDYFSYHKYLVENSTINETYSLRNGKILLELEGEKCKNCCEGLYISCSNSSTSSTLNYKSLDQVQELYFSPWTAAIYSNGRYQCMGTLLNQHWIVTSSKCFTGITSLHGKYSVAIFGRGKINLPLRGPHEQIVRIVESVIVNETDIILLRLEQEVKYNRYVQATNLNVRKDGNQKEKCYAIGQDNENKVKFVLLSPIRNCLIGFRCFEKKIEEHCRDTHFWSGTIVCDSRNGWYPAAVFNEESGHCGFHHVKKYTSVKFYKNEISRIIKQTAVPVLPPECAGLQCNLGNCIPKEKVCDGVVDCHGGEDETTALCYEKEKECYTYDNCVCPQTHLKCPASHKCFPKSSFCDRINNCGEFEDEPNVCSCRNYLKLTEPRKICDGVLHCMDRSDEDPNICNCGLENFQCGKTNKCVSQDVVCDGVKDCANGEDEATCLSLNTKSHDRTNAGEVMTRTAGLWHPGCFDLSYTTLQLEEICYRLGFSGASANQLTPPNNISTLTTSRPILDTFDVVWLRRQPGNKLKLRIRTGHDPYVKFVPDKSCHRLFIACI